MTCASEATAGPVAASSNHETATAASARRRRLIAPHLFLGLAHVLLEIGDAFRVGLRRHGARAAPGVADALHVVRAGTVLRLVEAPARELEPVARLAQRGRHRRLR